MERWFLFANSEFTLDWRFIDCHLGFTWHPFEISLYLRIICLSILHRAHTIQDSITTASLIQGKLTNVCSCQLAMSCFVMKYWYVVPAVIWNEPLWMGDPRKSLQSCWTLATKALMILEEVDLRVEHGYGYRKWIWYVLQSHCDVESFQNGLDM